MIKIIKNILRKLGLVIIKSHDNELIKGLKEKFLHRERGFVYGGFKYMVDSIDCHATPGVIESILVEFDDNLQKGAGGKKLLNLGGGTGQVADIYRAIGLDVYNLDIAVEQESEKNKQYDLNLNMPLPYETESFDFVVCSEIIEHLENPWKLFRDVMGMLKSGGIFILSTPNVLSRYSRFLFFLKGYFQWFTPECHTYHINPLPLWELRIINERIGFKELKILGSGDFFLDRGNNNIDKILKNNEGLIVVFQKQ